MNWDERRVMIATWKVNTHRVPLTPTGRSKILTTGRLMILSDVNVTVR